MVPNPITSRLAHIVEFASSCTKVRDGVAPLVTRLYSATPVPAVEGVELARRRSRQGKSPNSFAPGIELLLINCDGGNGAASCFPRLGKIHLEELIVIGTDRHRLRWRNSMSRH